MSVFLSPIVWIWGKWWRACNWFHFDRVFQRRKLQNTFGFSKSKQCPVRLLELFQSEFSELASGDRIQDVHGPIWCGSKLLIFSLNVQVWTEVYSHVCVKYPILLSMNGSNFQTLAILFRTLTFLYVTKCPVHSMFSLQARWSLRFTIRNHNKS